MSDRKLMQQALEALENPWKAGPDGVANAITALRERLADSPVNESLTTGSCIACGNRMTGSPEHFVVATAEVGVTAPEGYSPQQVGALHPHKVGDKTAPPLVNRIADILVEDHMRLAQPEQEHIIDCPRCGHCCPQQQVQKRPQNCGTGYCSCVECLFEPEQPVQEPVKFKCTVIDDANPNGVPLSQWECQSEQEPFCYHDGRNIVGKEFADHSDVFPLYTAPQRREWVGLTDEEIMEPWPFENRVAFARWLEAKLKEKNT